MDAKSYNDPKRDPLNWDYRNPPLAPCDHEGDAACFICNPKLFNGASKQERILHSSIALGSRLLIAKNNFDMSDEEYDAMERSLRAIDPNNPVIIIKKKSFPLPPGHIKI